MSKEDRLPLDGRLLATASVACLSLVSRSDRLLRTVSRGHVGAGLWIAIEVASRSHFSHARRGSHVVNSASVRLGGIAVVSQRVVKCPPTAVTAVARSPAAGHASARALTARCSPDGWRAVRLRRLPQNGTGRVPPQQQGLPSHPGHVPPSAWRTARAQQSVAGGLASSTWPPPPTPSADDRRRSRGAAHQRALHRRGECSPCFFHLNGVCQFGSGCCYCHEPHDETSWRRRRAPKFMRVALRARQAHLAV